MIGKSIAYFKNYSQDFRLIFSNYRSEYKNNVTYWTEPIKLGSVSDVF